MLYHKLEQDQKNYEALQDSEVVVQSPSDLMFQTEIDVDS